MNILLNIAKSLSKNECFVCKSKINYYFNGMKCSKRKCSIKLRSKYSHNNFCCLNIGKTAIMISNCNFSDPLATIHHPVFGWTKIPVKSLDNVDPKDFDIKLNKLLTFQ